jgi:hypothetical protein
MPITTAPFANLAIFPVSSVISRDPISKLSLKVSSILVPARGDSESGGDGDREANGAKPRRPLQIVRKPSPLHVRMYGREEMRGFLRVATDAIVVIGSMRMRVNQGLRVF